MKTKESMFLRRIAAVGLVCFAGFSFAESQVTEHEEHFVRALRDRTNLLEELNNLALEKSSNKAIQTFATRTNGEFSQRMEQIVAIAGELEISGVGGMGGAPAGGGQGNGAPPANAERAGGPPAGGNQASAAPGNQSRGGGPSSRNKAVIDPLAALDGDAFDRAFVLSSIRVYEQIERHVLGEILLTEAHPKLVAWSKSFVIPYARDAASVEAILDRKGDGNPLKAAKADDPNRSGPLLDQMNPGDLFGLKIK